MLPCLTNEKKKLIQFETNSNKTVNVLINEEVSVFLLSKSEMFFKHFFVLTLLTLAKMLVHFFCKYNLKKE